MPRLTTGLRYVVHSVVCPAGTLESAPQSTSWPVGNFTVEEFDIIIPPGHAALTGIALAYDGVRVLPFGETAFLVSDNDFRTYEFGMDVSHPITVVTFNEDVYDHEFRLRAKLRQVGAFDTGAGRAIAPVEI